MRKTFALVGVLALAALGLSACGGSSDSSSSSSTASTTSTSAGGGGGGGETVALEADPSGQLAYQEKSLSAKAGNVTIDFDNPAQIGHDVCIESPSGEQVGCSDIVSGGKATLSEDLQPGDYTFYCSVDGHRAAGMEGTLTVK